MSARSSLSEWRALTASALESLAAADVPALLTILERREQLLPSLAADVEDAQLHAELKRAESELRAGAEKLRDVVTHELREIRGARGKLQARDRGTRAPAITSLRA